MFWNHSESNTALSSFSKNNELSIVLKPFKRHGSIYTQTVCKHSLCFWEPFETTQLWNILKNGIFAIVLKQNWNLAALEQTKLALIKMQSFEKHFKQLLALNSMWLRSWFVKWFKTIETNLALKRCLPVLHTLSFETIQAPAFSNNYLQTVCRNDLMFELVEAIHSNQCWGLLLQQQVLKAIQMQHKSKNRKMDRLTILSLKSLETTSIKHLQFICWID